MKTLEELAETSPIKDTVSLPAWERGLLLCRELVGHVECIPPMRQHQILTEEERALDRERKRTAYGCLFQTIAASMLLKYHIALFIEKRAGIEEFLMGRTDTKLFDLHTYRARLDFRAPKNHHVSREGFHAEAKADYDAALRIWANIASLYENLAYRNARIARIYRDLQYIVQPDNYAYAAQALGWLRVASTGIIKHWHDAAQVLTCAQSLHKWLNDNPDPLVETYRASMDALLPRIEEQCQPFLKAAAR